MASRLFEPIDLRGLRLPNRIVIAPMTQFSAPEGVAGDWHLMHLGQYAVSGAAMVLTESTYVAANARNARSCLSLYTDEQEAAVSRIAGFFTAHSPGAFGVQLCHAGRKASAREPWKGGGPLPRDEGGYGSVAPSAVPISDAWPAPTPLDAGAIAGVIEAFANAARRAHRAGARVIEIHGAHGCDFMDVSSGGLSPEQRIETGPGYQTGFAAAVKEAVDMPVVAVGQISNPFQAETILRTGQADMIALARPVLFNPRWAWHAAYELGEPIDYPRQYERGDPGRWGARGINAPGNVVPGGGR